MEKIIYNAIGNFEVVENSEENRTISGYAIVFNTLSKPKRDVKGTLYYERVNPNAITESTIQNSDIVMTFNHSNDMILARSNGGHGTLNLEIREQGLFFSFKAPDTNLGNEVLYNVRSGNLYECSFAVLLSDVEFNEYEENGMLIAEMSKIDRLFDVSVVTRAAYPGTSVHNSEGDISYIDDIQALIKNSKEEKEDEKKDENEEKEEDKEKKEENSEEEKNKEDEKKDENEEKDPEDEKKEENEEKEDEEEKVKNAILQNLQNRMESFYNNIK